jgi:hypothetical protein
MRLLCRALERTAQLHEAAHTMKLKMPAAVRMSRVTSTRLSATDSECCALESAEAEAAALEAVALLAAPAFLLASSTLCCCTARA